MKPKPDALPVQDTAGADITPTAPTLIANLAWLIQHGRKRWRLVALASLVVIAGSLLTSASGLIRLQSVTKALIDFRIQRTVNNLRLSYPKARDSLGRGTGRFGEVDNDIEAILKLDPRNGHGLYYAGESKRINTPVLFTPKSCLIGSALAAKPQPLDAYENDFARYLDIEKAQPDAMRKGDYSAETCYSRPEGYCPQRTAWVHHLLANDRYEEAMASPDVTAKGDKLRRALEHAEAAAELYKDERDRPGFGECRPTTVLIEDAKRELAALKP
jgi:hypothetical protein